jgi:alpha-ketoglutaric semialdehyde dehydrogenase
MLNQRLRDAFDEELAEVASQPGVELVAGGTAAAGAPDLCATVVAVDSGDFASSSLLQQEHFGPLAVVVRCHDLAEILELVGALPGSLTATIHAERHEAAEVAELVDALRVKAGRLIWNGYPTGVAVTDAMQHGGPWPATTFPAHTSVGSAAIKRFLRPVTYQDYPPALLPPALRDENPLGLLRLVDGQWSTTAVESAAPPAPGA